MPSAIQTPNASLACIVLAAGQGKRFGSDKRKARLPGGTELLGATLNTIPSDFGQHILVLHPGDEEFSKQIPACWQVVFADQSALGMAHSLSAAVAALVPCTAVMVALGDMPAIRPETFSLLSSAAASDRLTVPRFHGRRGNPVMIGADFFKALGQLQGDQGARQLFQAHPEAIHWLDCNDPAILQDVDIPEDLQQFTD